MNFSKRVATFLLAVVVTLLTGVSVAQNMNPSNLSNSPYNRYGYGRLGSLGNATTRSMGDVGIAVRSNQYTTLANPASLTAIDTLTCLFSVGLDAEYGAISESGARETRWDAGFSYMSFQVPLMRNFAMSLSLTPYSMVGYDYGQKLPIQSPIQSHDTLTYSSTHAGVGGVNDFMLGIGWRALHTKYRELNLGVNAGWLFGNIEHDGQVITSSQATGTFVSHNAAVRGLFLRLGAQYTYRWGEGLGRSLTVGATYSPKLNLSVNTETLKYSADTIRLDDRYRSSVKLPASYGLGLTYNVARKLTVTAEAELTQWSQVMGFNPEMQAEEGIFNDSKRFAVGVEYQPKVLTNNYWKICRYRAGLTAKSSYLRVADHSLNEFGANLGISLPVSGYPNNRRSSIDLGIGYSTLQPSGGSMVKENYLTFTVGLTYNEMMFFRNKLR